MLVLAATGSSAFAAPSAARATGHGATYTFAVIPFYTPEKIWTLYSPFIDYLNKNTGVSWELQLYHSHDDLIADLCSGKISAALLGPAPLGRANNKCGATPLLAALGKDGKPSYHSVIMTNSPTVSSLKNLKGKKFGFFKGSTAAHILPAKMLKDAGLGMADIQPVFFESQDRIISALLSGEIAAAGVKETLARKFSGEGLKIIAVSPPLPNFSLCATPTLAAAVKQSLTSSLIRLKPLTNSKDAETVKSWDDEIKHGFTLPDKEFLPSVMKIFGIFSEIQGTSR
jgi:phosphonate transport system substrate-binding protein